MNYAGLAIPYFQLSENGINRDVSEWAIRRDIPDYEKNGAGQLKERRKYIKPPGAKNQIYIPPMMPTELLRYANSIFVITEGEIKTLALARVATNDFTSAKWSFVPLGISGVDNFKTKRKAETPYGERLVSEGIADFQKINFGGAPVCICFDSDLPDKPNVRAARKRLTSFLKEKGAKVYHINLPKLRKLGAALDIFHSFVLTARAVMFLPNFDAFSKRNLGIIFSHCTAPKSFGFRF